MTSTNSSERRREDLTEIKGIGEATERWLNRSLDVWTYADLAARSTDEIEAGMKASGRSAPRSRIEQWLVRARELAGGPTDTPMRGEEYEGEQVPEKSDSKREQESWKPFATFVVEFQSRRLEGGTEEQRTVCQQHETAREETWFGVDCERACDWMLKQMGEQLRGMPEEELSAQPPTVDVSSAATNSVSVEAQSQAETPAALEITCVRAFQPKQSKSPRAVATAGENFSGTVSHKEPVSFELDFQLEGPDAIDLSKSRSRFSAEVYAYNRTTSTNQHLVVTDAGSTVSGELSYTMVLPESMLPTGTYRLDCFATLEGATAAKGYLKVPFLRVA